jgi:hypothetical protein
VEFCGRKDHQVKLRGYRIETGEVEARLLAYPGIRESVVTVRTAEAGYQYLVGFYVADAEIPISALREDLASHLPDYMVPTHYGWLTALPLTPNGKINYQALPEVSGGRSARDEAYLAPESELERLIAGIWQTKLGTELIGVHDNIFDLGGNSVLLVQIHAQLVKLLAEQVAVTVADLFAYPTVYKLARYLEEKLVPAHGEVAAGREYWEQEMAGMDSYLVLPDEYYQDQPFALSQSLKFQLQGELLAQLDEVASQVQVELADILAAMYIYLLAQLAKMTDLVIGSNVRGTEELFPMRIRLAEVSDFSELFRMVQAKYQQAQEIGGYSRWLTTVGDQLLPVFWTAGHHGATKGDLICRAEMMPGRVTMIFTYNADKLKGEKVAGMVESYAGLLEALVQEYYS